MPRVDMDVAARDRHVLRELTFDCEVALQRVGVFKVFLYVQGKRQHWSKTGERLIVESLAAELVLSARGNTRRYNSCRTYRSDWSTRRTNCSLKHLYRVKQRRLRRT